ncbi:Transcription factor GRAS [Artemisia annua]|uniref:Transcription factor GRAS n=1 Tax=Artemisia annua TaxID=35608 RepID=A0A2U1LNL6_ARTAN|nr:Transcription factor GRAS [Artemisia annua]
MNPNSIFNHTKRSHFNPFETYGDIVDMAPDQQLPALEDPNQTINIDFHVNDHKVHDQIIPEFNKSVNANSKSKLTYQELPSPTYLGLLSNYQSKFKRLREDSANENVAEVFKNLSTVEIIELAAEKFIMFSTQKVNGYTMFTHPYGSSAFTSLSVDETREVELVFQLLTAAEKIGRKQYETGSKFLTRCGWVASDSGTPVERVVHYFCEALKKRISKESGIPVPMKLEKLGIKNENPMGMGTNPTFLAFHQALPFNQVLHFSGIQAILDQVGTSSKVHLIDIHIRSGIQWTAMMQALADQKSHIELLKLTAFATSTDVQKVGETGKRLESFAASMNLPFLFKILVLSDISEVDQEQFEVHDDEVVAVYCHVILRTMVTKPQKLDNLMRAIRTINPSIIVMAEVEANHNSTSFVSRFTETLFFYGALFDCLDACMSRDDVHRAMLEGIHFANGMQNIVSAEGEERVSRSVDINTWRSFFTRFGMVEIELSDSCMYQANLVLQQFSCASSCMLENNGKSLILGWKGTPLHSLSTWKFLQE